MFYLRTEYHQPLSLFLEKVRLFFKEKNYWEIETPLLQHSASVEAHLDSLKVFRSNQMKGLADPSFPQGPLLGYLITSPEYSLKAVLADLRRSIFQIAHSFRSGDVGALHHEEFLLLEWYGVGMDEFQMMKFCESFLNTMCQLPFSAIKYTEPLNVKYSTVSSLLKEYAQCTWVREELEKKVIELKVTDASKIGDWHYDDLFFSVFLNLIEPHLGIDGPEFVYHYPIELRALSQIERNYSRRFEIYWKGIELANGYFEITDPQEYTQRFHEENNIRFMLKKERINEPAYFFEKLRKNKGLPLSTGVAMGLERLFVLVLGLKNFEDVFEYPNIDANQEM